MSKEIRIGWCSDSHLGKNQYGLEARRKDFADAFLNAIQGMLKQGIRLILNTGDILNSNRPGPNEILVLQQANKILAEHKATMLLIEGNHDATTPHWSTVLNASEDRRIVLLQHELWKQAGISVYGVPFMAPAEFKARSRDFKAADILMMHQPVREFVDFQNPNDLSIDDLPTDRYRLIAMGDIHDYKFKGKDGCIVGYPGSTEYCADGEPTVKYWVEIGIYPDRETAITLIPRTIKTREIVQLDIWREEDVAVGLAGMAAAMKEPEPMMVFINFLNTIPLVQERFRSQFGDKCILRFKPVFTSPGTTQDAPVKGSKLSIEEILREMAGNDQETFTLTSALLNMDLEPNAVLDDYLKGQGV